MIGNLNQKQRPKTVQGSSCSLPRDDFFRWQLEHERGYIAPDTVKSYDHMVFVEKRVRPVDKETNK